MALINIPISNFVSGL